LSDHYICR